MLNEHVKVVRNRLSYKIIIFQTTFGRALEILPRIILRNKFDGHSYVNAATLLTQHTLHALHSQHTVCKQFFTISRANGIKLIVYQTRTLVRQGGLYTANKY